MRWSARSPQAVSLAGIFLLEAIKNTVMLIGIDLVKPCFHLDGQEESGRMVFGKELPRSQMLTYLVNVPACHVVMEARAVVY